MKIENDYLIFEKNDNIKLKKITGTTFPALLGLDPFKKKGDCLLSMLNYVKEDFDVFYTKRGDIAEKIAKVYLEKNGFKCTTYDKFEINFDNFPENKSFGGLIDIELLENDTLVEVKSKSLKDFNEIIKNNGCLHQELQGLHYGWLRKYNFIKMIWIFFDEDTENEIKNNKPITSYNKIKKFEKEILVNNMEQDNLHKQVLQYVYDCLVKNKAIPLQDISDKYLKLLGFERPKEQSREEIKMLKELSF